MSKYTARRPIEPRPSDGDNRVEPASAPLLRVAGLILACAAFGSIVWHRPLGASLEAVGVFTTKAEIDAIEEVDDRLPRRMGELMLRARVWDSLPFVGVVGVLVALFARGKPPRRQRRRRTGGGIDT